MREFISEAGFRTLKAFGEAVGLEDYELSRILSVKAPRRPTGLQLRKIANGLDKKTEELASLLLSGGLEQELLEEVVGERDQLLKSVSEIRGELLEARGGEAAAQEQICALGQTIVEFYRQVECLQDEVAGERARAAALEERRSALLATRTQLQEANRALELRVAAKEHELTSVQERAAAELAHVYAELQKIREDRGRDEIKSLQKQILAGTLGAAVGAIITGAASSK